MSKRTRYYLMSYTSVLAAALVIWAGVFSDESYLHSPEVVRPVVLFATFVGVVYGFVFFVKAGQS
jgi:hypothetical protein